MIAKCNAAERFHTTWDWLDSWHTFSFGDHHHPDQMGFRSLRVINDDTVKSGQGFGTHGHRDMEIITYVLEGELEHQDSLGTGSVIWPGDGQRMSAGTGIRHSEFNHSKQAPVHFLQIWIQPAHSGIAPGYEQKTFARKEKQGALRLIASPDGAQDSVTVHQDIQLYSTLLSSGQQVTHVLESGRHAWVQVARGSVTLNGVPLQTGDGAAVSGEAKVELVATEPTELLLFDLN